MHQSESIDNAPDSTNGHHHRHLDEHYPPTFVETHTALPEPDLEAKLRSPEFLREFELDRPPVQRERIERAAYEILAAVGEDATRDGLQKTPHRVAKAYDELLSGYRIDPVALINGAIFRVEFDDMVVVHNIEYASLCEHHMLPFLGHAHVAYIPGDRVIGLSKIPRIVDMFARRLQVQERMTRQIARFLWEVLQPQGIIVAVDGEHMCSKMRGVEKCHSGMTTTAALGCFKTDRELRREFMEHLARAQK